MNAENTRREQFIRHHQRQVAYRRALAGTRIREWAAEDAPVLEGIHLRKHFPLRQFKFGPRPVVHAVEDAITRALSGRALALVGESGSGKSTIARLLARLYQPTAGRPVSMGKPRHRQGREPRCVPTAVTCR